LQKPLCTLELSDVSIIYSRSEIHLPTIVPEQFRTQSNSAVCKSWNPPERLWSRDTVTASGLLCSLSENTEHSLRHWKSFAKCHIKPTLPGSVFLRKVNSSYTSGEQLWFFLQTLKSDPRIWIRHWSLWNPSRCHN